MTDFHDFLAARNTELECALAIERNRTRKLRASRAMWRQRCRDAERTTKTARAYRDRVKELEAA